MRDLITDAPVFLIYPSLPEYSYKVQVQDRESLALGYLIAALECEGVSVNAVNAELLEMDNLEVVDLLAQCHRTILVGISAGSEKVFPHVEAMAADIKSRLPKVHINIGGIFATTAYEDILRHGEYIDSVTIGEGERVIYALYVALAEGRPLSSVRGIKFVRGKEVCGVESPRIKNLDALPFPSRRDLEFMLSPAGPGVRKAKLSTSRGCYAQCSFCSIHEIFGDRLVYRRSPENIVAEIKQISRKYGIRRFSFMDDLFITPSVQGRSWVEEFCNLVMEEELNVRFWIETRADTLDADILSLLIRAGMDSIFIGIEAGSAGVLQRMRKDVTVEQNAEALRLLKQSILDPENVRFGYIMFTPDMTMAELEEQYQWIKESGHCRVQTLQNRMNIYRGTPEYKRLKARGKLREMNLGTLAQYDFDDSEVGRFEAAFRFFHQRCIADLFDNVHDLQKRYVIYKQKLLDDYSSPIRNLMSQMLRQIEYLERQHYYDYFDAALFGSPAELCAVTKLGKPDLPRVNRLVQLLNELISHDQAGGKWDLKCSDDHTYLLHFCDCTIRFENGFVSRDILGSSCTVSD